MGRYFKFDGNSFDFATRCDVSWRKEYFMDFVFGGARDQRIYGLTRLTPELTAEYDINGLYFLKYVMGTITGAATAWTLTVADLISNDTQISTIHAGIDTENAGILNAKVDYWELTVEQGAPAKAEFSCIGRNTTVVAPTAMTADFSQNVVMPSNCSLGIGGTSIGFSRFVLRIANALEPIFKTDTLPVTIRATGCEVTGRIAVPNYLDSNIVDGSIGFGLGTLGTFAIGVAKLMEIPPRVTGFDIPETEYSFTGFPSATAGAIKVICGSTAKW